MSRAGGDHGARPALVVPGVPQCPALVAGDDAETLASSVVGVLGRCGLTRCDDGGAAEWQHFPVGVEAAVTVEMPVCQGAGKFVDRTVQSGASAASAPWVSQPSSAAARTTSPASSSTCRRYSCSSSSGSSTSTVCRLRPRAAQQFRVFNPAARVSEVNQCRIAGASCHGHLESTYTVGTEHLAAEADGRRNCGQAAIGIERLHPIDRTRNGWTASLV